uniref:Protein kinase domain-containing protein n=1 Tax=Arundo donax TaxID=35708 RepID=A0A0A9GFF1_ARUDO
MVSVKVLKKSDTNSERELQVVFGLRHVNLIRLLASCNHETHDNKGTKVKVRILVYEYMHRRSLDLYIFGTNTNLDMAILVIYVHVSCEFYFYSLGQYPSIHTYTNEISSRCMHVFSDVNTWRMNVRLNAHLPLPNARAP